MNPAGVVIAIAGMWIVSQVFAGNALERLNILKPRAADTPTVPPGLVPGITPYLPGGDKNPVAPSLPDIWGGLGGKYL